MNPLSSLYLAHQLIQKIAPTVPPVIQQLADQIDGQTQQLLTDIAHYGLLIAGLTSAIALLLSSLPLVLHYPRTNPAQPTLRLIRSVSSQQPLLRRPVENRVARANRAELRLVSARIRAGQLSN
ncbi:MAG: hypothetical protein H7Z72_09930 [Bacteroidetes bacterium]|nr:hypothetical protein [Fibrella sp.]